MFNKKNLSFFEHESSKIKVVNLHGVRGQLVKNRRLVSDMVASLNCFYKFIRRINKLKLEIAIKVHENNRKLKLEEFKLTQALQERMVGLLLMCSKTCSYDNGAITCFQFSFICHFDINLPHIFIL